MAGCTHLTAAVVFGFLTIGCATSDPAPQQGFVRPSEFAAWVSADDKASNSKSQAAAGRDQPRLWTRLEPAAFDDNPGRHSRLHLSGETWRPGQDKDEVQAPEASGKIEQKDETGTDPRGFGSKLMPYYRFTELNNDVQVHELTMFGMIGFSKQFAMTYEWAIVKQIDYTDVLPIAAPFPPGNGTPLPTGGGFPDDLDADGDNNGYGDLNLRFFYWPDAFNWEYGDKKNIALIPIMEMTLPTATDDVLGGETWVGSPGFALVIDLPGGPPFGLGFLAMMNFYDFDITRDNSTGQTSRFRGRWFWMQPLVKPGPGLLDGLYLLTETQPVYDFRRDDFSLWIAPELGKMLSPGRIIYLKPGWGVDREGGDREFTIEVGFRYFF